MMKMKTNRTERPIIFSTLMVQAILEGRKIMTRRIVKIPDVQANPDRFRYAGNSNEIEIPTPAIGCDDRMWHQFKVINNNGTSWNDVCPYGKPGDRLWVRETFFSAKKFKEAPLLANGPDFYYKSDNAIIGDHKWKPSIHMPKAAARIWLEITKIRVERLHSITEEDATAEGIEMMTNSVRTSLPKICFRIYTTNNSWDVSPIFSFYSLWENINGYGSWQENPWVWVIEFKRVEGGQQ
jgi:hypothetical protein